MTGEPQHQLPMGTPREEQTLEDVYKEAEFGSPKRQHLLSTRVDNDWADRLSRVVRPPPCVLWDRENGFGSVPGYSSCTGNHVVEGKRGRGRPRKYPLPPIETAVHPMLGVDIHRGIPLPPAPILDGQLGQNNVEYDADEQDHRWLDAVNANSDVIDEEIDVLKFERVITLLESTWFSMTRHQQRQQAKITNTPYNQVDMTCEICRKSESDNPTTNLLVLCDGCDLVVHQDCYGIPHIPEGPWLCRACGEGSRYGGRVASDTTSCLSPPACCLCPWPGGALKPTSDGRWAHLVCGQWTPGAQILNPSLLEPIDVSGVDPERFRLKCYLCQLTIGAPLQCDHPKCMVPFHAYCAFRAGLTMKPPQELAQSDHRSGGKRHVVKMLKVTLCGKHGPVDLKLRIPKSFLKSAPTTPSHPLTVESSREPSSDIVASSSDVDIESDYCFPLSPNTLVPEEVKYEKKRDALVQIYPLTIKRPPIKRIPTEPTLAMVEQVADDLSVSVKTVSLIAKYWALKRAAQDDFPLIRRYQFEPWSPRRKADRQVVDTLSYIVNDFKKVIDMSKVKAEVARQQCIAARVLYELVTLAMDNPQYIPIVLQTIINKDSSALDDCMDEYVWVFDKKARKMVAGIILDNDDTDQGFCTVKLYNDRHETLRVPPRCIHILSNDYDADCARFKPTFLDRESHRLAVQERLRINPI